MTSASTSDSRRPAAIAPQRQFGAFLGVFTPSVLTILGVIMFLRFGWVIASAGLGGTILIVLTSASVAFITALSASMVATNVRLGAGGEYYLISRSLGLPIGGAIGIPLFLCRMLSVTLYCYGLAEALVMFWPSEAWGRPPVPWIAAGLVLATTAIAGRSAALSLRIQIPLMALVTLSLAALVGGVLTGPLRAPQWFAWSDRLPQAGGFWTVLAVYFPAVTGFTAGIGLSGDLKDPQRSIPRGTLLAVVIGTLIYLIVPICLAATGRVSLDELGDIRPEAPPVWTRIALLGGLLVLPGMWSAILSSAFGSALSGPRVLQALARDGLAPRFLQRTSRTGQPTVAAWIGGAIALSAVALGNLNAVARVVTIFFLTLYLAINLAAAVETLVRDPSFRPTIRVPWAVSLCGAGGSLAIMFLISPAACAVAIGLELAVWAYLRRRTLRAGWGDVWAGVWGSLARFALYKLTVQAETPRSWRPHILLFADHIEQRADLVRLAALLNHNHGILTVCEVIEGRPEQTESAVRRRELAMNRFFRRQGIVAFAEVDVVERFDSGVVSIVQANGMGALRSNTVAFGWPSRRDRLQVQLRMMRTLSHLGKAVLILRPGSTATNGRPDGAGPESVGDHRLARPGRIDIWWRGMQNNGDLMILLAHLLTLDPLLRSAEINLRSIVNTERDRRTLEAGLGQLIASVRIKARRHVIVNPDAPDAPPGQTRDVTEIIRRTSRDADLVFLGLKIPDEGDEADYAERLSGLLDGLPTTVLVRNSGPFEGRLV